MPLLLAPLLTYNGWAFPNARIVFRSSIFLKQQNIALKELAFSNILIQKNLRTYFHSLFGGEQECLENFIPF
jgi:hypothetical protein